MRELSNCRNIRKFRNGMKCRNGSNCGRIRNCRVHRLAGIGRIVSNVKKYRYFISAKPTWIFFVGPEVPIIAKDLVRTKKYHRNCGTVVFVGGEVKEL
jgi:hypothetical protein